MEKYVVKDYGRKAAFASFLPGISGVHGIPVWCYYVNRGQGVVSFGIQDKDHAIMEFYPAHQAYQNVKRTGFRTFVKKDGVFLEPFSREEKEQEMEISMNQLLIREEDAENALAAEIVYYTLPDEPLGALVRRLEFRNTGDAPASVEVLDGMPALIPYGVDMDNIKNMGQTVKAWMQVEDVESGLPYFRVRASVKDTASVQAVKEGCFSIGYTADGRRLKPVVDPELVFEYDTSLEKPVGFLKEPLSRLQKKHQEAQNQFPCSFYGTEARLLPGETLTLYQVIGQASDKKILASFAEKIGGEAYFQQKQQRAGQLTDELVRDLTVKTASAEFDAYCRCTYLDNVLRGGYPLLLGGNKVFYVYSRKHGDLERDYNYFSMLPEYYSQGNGNFRDVNQNRRCDVFFHPYVGTENIRTFYSLIQMDGYNPLKVEMMTCSLDEKQAKDTAALLEAQTGKSGCREAEAFLQKPFTPGRLLAWLEERMPAKSAEAWFDHILGQAQSGINASFGEGYWSDHWTYNLDLVENYLSVFPEREEALLFEEAFLWYAPEGRVNPRQKRYVKTEKGIRQYHALEEAEEIRKPGSFVQGEFGKGNLLSASLMEKLLLLCTVKYAALDAYGCGVEMEGGKPGWYDALNGMPGLFGSSLAESCELGRMLEFTLDMLKKYDRDVEVFEELAALILQLQKITKEEWAALTGSDEVLGFWNKCNDVKEAYRGRIYSGVSGRKKTLGAKELVNALEKWHEAVQIGLEKAERLTGDLAPAYLTWEIREFAEDGEGIRPLHFVPVRVPLFLEGAVRRLKLKEPREKKLEIYEKVKAGDLYDRKLSMYKVNASLSEASYELGRARAFTPGWLENESVWLHMEYKYLLELLKNGMYREFFADFRNAAIPFLDPEVYGRSILENSSFLVSSKNPNTSLHGRGFVARLSGSTVEWIQMWILMFFGEKPFAWEDGELKLAFAPAVPAWLIGEEGTVEALFMGKTPVCYHMDKKADFFPGSYRVKKLEITFSDGGSCVCETGFAAGETAERIRNGEAERIDVMLEHDS